MDDIISIVLDLTHIFLVWFTKLNLIKLMGVILTTTIMGLLYTLLISEVTTLISIMFW